LHVTPQANPLTATDLATQIGADIAKLEAKLLRGSSGRHVQLHSSNEPFPLGEQRAAKSRAAALVEAHLIREPKPATPVARAEPSSIVLPMLLDIDTRIPDLRPSAETEGQQLTLYNGSGSGNGGSRSSNSRTSSSPSATSPASRSLILRTPGAAAGSGTGAGLSATVIPNMPLKMARTTVRPGDRTAAPSLQFTAPTDRTPAILSAAHRALVASFRSQQVSTVLKILAIRTI
jgi:hypothetical protein